MISQVPCKLRADSQTAAALLLLRQQQIALGDMITGVWTAESLVQVDLLHCRTFRFMCIDTLFNNGTPRCVLQPHTFPLIDLVC